MALYDKFTKVVKTVLPTPFTIAVLLTFITWLLAFFFGSYRTINLGERFYLVLNAWGEGLWNNNLLVFAMQMMLMLVLGHILALSKPIDTIIKRALTYCKDTASSAAIVVFLTMLVGLFNWGLGLMFGAIFARKIGEKFTLLNTPINYPLIGASGYASLMVWHGGLSGSSLIKVAEPNHLKNLLSDTNLQFTNILPTKITLAETVFSPMNCFVTLLLLVVIPIIVYKVGKGSKTSLIKLNIPQVLEKTTVTGAERLDSSKLLGVVFGILILTVVLLKLTLQYKGDLLSFFIPNNINLLLLGLAILFHARFSDFLISLQNAIGDVSGILIQFPLYFGIMSVMKESGLVELISQGMVAISTKTTYPIFTFFSAGIVNLFVPSGGGQWAIQGPIVVKSASQLGVSLSKSIMALAYGDQITNMIQPFWALPLLGITGLKAREILPYTLLLFLIGVAIFLTGLILF